MTPRRIILGLIVLAVVCFCGLAAAKLTATPKFDRVRVGMYEEQVEAALGEPTGCLGSHSYWRTDEGVIWVHFRTQLGSTGWSYTAVGKELVRRDPVERLMWLSGWRLEGRL